MIPAVSVLNLLFPSVVGLKPFCNAKFISFSVKSPSGPIKIVYFFWFDLLILFFSVVKQCAINLSPSNFSFIKSLKLDGAFNLGL